MASSPRQTRVPNYGDSAEPGIEFCERVGLAPTSLSHNVKLFFQSFIDEDGIFTSFSCKAKYAHVPGVPGVPGLQLSTEDAALLGWHLPNQSLFEVDSPLEGESSPLPSPSATAALGEEGARARAAKRRREPGSLSPQELAQPEFGGAEAELGYGGALPGAPLPTMLYSVTDDRSAISFDRRDGSLFIPSQVAPAAAPAPVRRPRPGAVTKQQAIGACARQGATASTSPPISRPRAKPLQLHSAMRAPLPAQLRAGGGPPPFQDAPCGALPGAPRSFCPPASASSIAGQLLQNELSELQQLVQRRALMTSVWWPLVQPTGVRVSAWPWLV